MVDASQPSSQGDSRPTSGDPSAMADRLAERLSGAGFDERHLEVVLDLLPVGVWVADRNGRLVYRNESAAEIWGEGAPLSRSHEEYGEDYRAWRPDGTRVEADEWGLTRALTRGESVDGEELSIETRSGERKVVLNYARPLRDSGGEVSGAVALNVDVTERRRAEEEVRVQAQLLEAVGQAVIATDLEGTVTYWNGAAEELFGWSRREALGESIVGLTPAETQRGAAQEIMDAVTAGDTWTGEFEVRRKDGTTFPARVTDSPIRDRTGEIVGVVGVAYDLSDARRAARERESLIETLREERTRLMEAREEAERADRAKSDFLAVMSHELRTPLNAIVGYADLMEQGIAGDLPPGLKRPLERIRLSARHLQSIIDQVLDVSRMELGREALSVQPVALSEVVREVEAVIDPLAEAKGLSFDIDTTGAPEVIDSDPGKLRQILLNLLGNAVKFTEEGRISLRVDADGDRVLFRVLDTGLGLTPEQRARVFEAFWQADQSSTRVSGGTGLGLTITRRLATALGGEAEVRDRPDTGGTEFTVRLPVAGPPPP